MTIFVVLSARNSGSIQPRLEKIETSRAWILVSFSPALSRSGSSQRRKFSKSSGVRAAVFMHAEQRQKGTAKWRAHDSPGKKPEDCSRRNQQSAARVRRRVMNLSKRCQLSSLERSELISICLESVFVDNAGRFNGLRD